MGEEFSLLCCLRTGVAEEWPSRGGAALGSAFLWFAAMSWGSGRVRTQPFPPELQAVWVLLRTHLTVPGRMLLAVHRVCAYLSLDLRARSLNLQMLLYHRIPEETIRSNTGQFSTKVTFFVLILGALKRLGAAADLEVPLARGCNQHCELKSESEISLFSLLSSE